ncbi:MAG: hypothetical protein ACLQDF_05615 [Desulfomonilia bacterium]
MIALKSTSSDGALFKVYKDNALIGYIHKFRGLTGDKYQASVDKSGEEENSGKVFDSPNDALQWIEKYRYVC